MANSRLLYANRPSPLATSGVAPGHYYDIRSGTVKQVSVQPPVLPPVGSDDQYIKPGCRPGATKDESFCNDGVHTRPKPY